MTDNKGERAEGDSFFVEFESFDKVTPEYLSRGIKETMFANHYDDSIL